MSEEVKTFNFDTGNNSLLAAILPTLQQRGVDTGMLMQCIEELGDDDMDERYGSDRYGSGGGSMGERYPMERGRMNGRDDWEDDDDDERMPQMGERRRRASNGRYA